jgi:hypothetical protein
VHRFYKEVRAKARTLGPWGLSVLLANAVIIFLDNLLEHRIYAWANQKLDEQTGPLVHIFAGVLKFVTEHPFQTGFYAISLFCVMLVVWAFAAGLYGPPTIPNEQPTPRLVVTNFDTLKVWMSANSHLTILNDSVGPVNPDMASVCYVRNEVENSSSRAGQVLNVNAHLLFLPQNPTHSEYEVHSADWLGIGGTATIAPGKSAGFVLCCYQSGGVPSLVEASHGRARMTSISPGQYDIIATLTWSAPHKYSKRRFHLLFDTASPDEARSCDLKRCAACQQYGVSGNLL